MTVATKVENMTMQRARVRGTLLVRTHSDRPGKHRRAFIPAPPGTPRPPVSYRVRALIVVMLCLAYADLTMLWVVN